MICVCVYICMNVWNTCPISGCIFPNTFFYKSSMPSNLNIGPEDTLILPLVKKTSAVTHISSTFIRKHDWLWKETWRLGTQCDSSVLIGLSCPVLFWCCVCGFGVFFFVGWLVCLFCPLCQCLVLNVSLSACSCEEACSPWWDGSWECRCRPGPEAVWRELGLSLM